MMTKSRTHYAFRRLDWISRYLRGETIVQIALSEGVTRQRVDFVIGSVTSNTYHSDRRRDIVLAHPEMTHGELAKKLGLSEQSISRIRVDAGVSYLGGHRNALQVRVEAGLAAKLDELGIAYSRQVYQSILYFRLENAVIYARYGKMLGTGQVRVMLSGRQDYADFIVVGYGEPLQYLIIPATEIDAGVKSIYVSKTWLPYKDRWDLIEKEN